MQWTPLDTWTAGTVPISELVCEWCPPNSPQYFWKLPIMSRPTWPARIHGRRRAKYWAPGVCGCWNILQSYTLSFSRERNRFLGSLEQRVGPPRCSINELALLNLDARPENAAALWGAMRAPWTSRYQWKSWASWQAAMRLNIEKSDGSSWDDASLGTMTRPP